jgi:ribosomal protein S18 acetylase RimI-like enzyme
LDHISVNRVAKPDRARFLRFFELCFRDEYASLLGGQTEFMLESLRQTQVDEILPGADQKMFEAVDSKDNTCGTIVMSQVDTTAYVWGLYVLPKHQRQGIGKKLMRQVCLETRPETEIEIQVLEASEKAISFYTGIGFSAYKSAKEEVFPGIELNVKFMTCAASTALTHLKA